MENPMSIGAMFLPEFEHEAANTRKVLERIPEAMWTWRPHPKSWTTVELATHVANLFDWAVVTLQSDSLDLASAKIDKTTDSRRDLLELLDNNVAAACSAIAEATDEQLVKPWTLLKEGQTVFSMPRATLLRTFVLNHVIHHRAQVATYLRLNDVPVPGLYGPSADEGSFA